MLTGVKTTKLGREKHVASCMVITIFDRVADPEAFDE